MEHNKLSSIQLFSIIFLCVGASSIYGFPYIAKQDAWIVCVISLFFGLIVGGLFLMIFYKSKMTLPEMFVYLFGNKVGVVIGVIYGVFFLYQAAMTIKSMNYLLINSFLYGASPLLISGVILLLVYFFVFAGLETLGRSSTLFCVLNIVLISVLVLIGFTSKSYEWVKLLPVQEKSISELVKIAFPLNTVYPYGELLSFTALVPLSLFKKPRYFLVSIAVSGAKITTLTILVVASLSPIVAENALYPVVLAVSQFQVASFIERLDPLAVNLLTTALLLKVVVFVYAAHACFGITYKVKETKKFSYLTAPLLLFLSVYITKSIIEHLSILKERILWSAHVPLEMIFPCFMLLVLLVKRKPHGHMQKEDKV